MPKAHFFKVKSRIGIINNPDKQKDNNIGVEDGADHILEENFLKHVNDYLVSDFSFPDPEDLSKEYFFNKVNKYIIDLQNKINREIEDDEIQIVIGGDHSISLPSVLAVIDRVGSSKKIGYVHFDSHGDINLYRESPSKNFHGMYLRPLFDDFDISLIDSLLVDKMPIENLLMIGNLDLDLGEFEFLNNKNIKTISRKNLLLDNKKTLKMFKDFINNFKYLHVSFDGDVLDKSVFSATGIPAEKGFMLSEIMQFIDLVAKCDNLSFDVAEFNPHKKKAKASKEVCQEILLKILKS